MLLEKSINNVFRAKHFEIFTTLVSLSFAEAIIEDISVVAGVILDLFSTIVILGWTLLLGYGLSKRQKDLNSIQFRVFIWTGILLIITICLFKIPFIAGGIKIDLEENILPFVILLIYSFVSLAIVLTYPMRTLKLLETKREIDINDYFGDIFLLLIWPIGIWSIQPRINRLADFELE